MRGMRMEKMWYEVAYVRWSLLVVLAEINFNFFVSSKHCNKVIIHFPVNWKQLLRKWVQKCQAGYRKMIKVQSTSINYSFSQT